MQDVGRKRVLAVASAGGHWIQLRRLTPAFEHHDCAYVTTSAGYRMEVTPHRYHMVCNAALSNKLGLVVLMAQVLRIVWKEKPDVVISTGAAPGFFAILFGKVIGAKTIWVDSIANADALSVSGRWARYFADLWLTQWPHLAKPTGPSYKGSIL
jgi:UDP-N-acetylglucosamine:LPS N-acetylglucosamine transferase